MCKNVQIKKVLKRDKNKKNGRIKTGLDFVHSRPMVQCCCTV